MRLLELSDHDQAEGAIANERGLFEAVSIRVV